MNSGAHPLCQECVAYILNLRISNASSAELAARHAVCHCILNAFRAVLAARNLRGEKKPSLTYSRAPLTRWACASNCADIASSCAGLASALPKMQRGNAWSGNTLGLAALIAREEADVQTERAESMRRAWQSVAGSVLLHGARAPSSSDKCKSDSCGVRTHALADWRLKPAP